MTVTVTNITPTTSRQTQVFTITADADADTTATITHQFANDNAAMVARSQRTGITDSATAMAHLKVELLPLSAAGQTSNWSAAFTDKDTLTLTKGTGTGSGNASPQLLVRVELPHTLTA